MTNGHKYTAEGTRNNNKYRKMMGKEEDEVQVLQYYLKSVAFAVFFVFYVGNLITLCDCVRNGGCVGW